MSICLKILHCSSVDQIWVGRYIQVGVIHRLSLISRVVSHTQVSIMVGTVGLHKSLKASTGSSFWVVAGMYPDVEPPPLPYPARGHVNW